MISNIYIRVDGSAEIGLGHLVRSIALAQMLKDEFNITFLSKEIPNEVVDVIKSNNFSLIIISNEEEFFSRLLGNEIVVLDNYYFDTAYQKKVKTYGSILVCIDDLQDKEFYADLILCQIPGIKPKDYQSQIYTEFLLGTKYVLLRSSFLKAVKAVKEKKKNSLLICFGGSDYNNLTRRSLLLALEFSFDNINVVVGAAYKGYNELLVLVEERSDIKIYQNLSEDELLATMLDSRYAIVPSSGILLETLAVGCETISGYYVENQRKVFESYKNLNLIHSAKDFSEKNIQKAYRVCLNNLENKKINSIDGNSGKRILKVFKQLSIESDFQVRRMNESDIIRTYEWASSSEIRKYSFSQHQISLEEHISWFNMKISDTCSFYYAVEYNKNMVGSIRYDIKNSEAVISYLVDPIFHGKGFGQTLLKMGMKKFLEDYKGSVDIVGYVMVDNLASINIFERGGYTKTIESDGSYKFTKKII